MAINLLRYCQLAYFSGPSCERAIYRLIARHKPQRIVEIGLGLGIRSIRMLDVAARYQPSSALKYTGIDPFDTRPDEQARLSLKDAYKLLRRNGVQIKLVPNTALQSMTATANEAANTDLIVIDADVEDRQLAQAWEYFPRMMHPQTLVLRQHSDENGKCFQRLSLPQIQQRSRGALQRDAA